MSELLRVSERQNQNKRCCVCHSEINSEPEVSCPGCDTKLHVDCYSDLKECPTLGCNMSFQSTQREGGEIDRTVGEPVTSDPSELNDFVYAWRALRHLFRPGGYLFWMTIWGIIAAIAMGWGYYIQDAYRFKKYFYKKAIPLMLLGFFVVGPLVGAGFRFLLTKLVDYGKGLGDPKK